MLKAYNPKMNRQQKGYVKAVMLCVLIIIASITANGFSETGNPLAMAIEGYFFNPGDTIEAKLRIDPESFVGLTGSIKLLPETGDSALKEDTFKVRLFTMAKELRLEKEFPAGKYRVVCSLRRGDKILGEAGARFRCVPKSRPVVDVEIKGRAVFVNGKPFFPLGLWAICSWKEHPMFDEADLRYVSSLGFNLVMPGLFHYPVGEGGMPRDYPKYSSYEGYMRSTPLKLEPYLDIAAKYGLRVMLSGSFFTFKRNLEDADLDRLMDFIISFRDHPAIVAWLASGESGTRPETNRAVYQAWRKIDPSRPVHICLNGIYELNAPFCDIFGADPYPIPRKPIRVAGGTTETVMQAVSGRKPIWMTFQIGRGVKTNFRSPVPVELRNIIYQAINHGATGILLYCYSPESSRRGSYRNSNELWESVRDLRTEIDFLAPILLVGTELEGQATGDGDLDLSLWKYQGKRYLIAVNLEKQDRYADITFKGIAFSTAIPLFEDRQGGLPVQKGTLRDSFGGYDVHVYRMK